MVQPVHCGFKALGTGDFAISVFGVYNVAHNCFSD